MCNIRVCVRSTVLRNSILQTALVYVHGSNKNTFPALYGTAPRTELLPALSRFTACRNTARDRSVNFVGFPAVGCMWPDELLARKRREQERQIVRET